MLPRLKHEECSYKEQKNPLPLGLGVCQMDNGVIPFLHVLEYLNNREVSLAESVDSFRATYPVSGEINFFFETDFPMRDAIDVICQVIYRCGDHPCIEKAC